MKKVSNCCGAEPVGASDDMCICPDCHEHCEYGYYDEDGNEVTEDPDDIPETVG